MISKACTLTTLCACGSLLLGATHTQAAEPAAQHSSAWDSKVVCHNVKNIGTQTRDRECATREQWRATRNLQLKCRWSKTPGSQAKEQVCETVGALRARDRARSRWGDSPGWGSSQALPSVPGGAAFHR